MTHGDLYIKIKKIFKIKKNPQFFFVTLNKRFIFFGLRQKINKMLMLSKKSQGGSDLFFPQTHGRHAIQ